jgi:large subunit ribosomal protein L2
MWRTSLKKLTRAKISASGRNNAGSISIRNRGGAHKKRYKIVDFSRDLDNVLGLVVRIEKDTNRSANIALIAYINGVLSYIIEPLGLKPGMYIRSGPVVGLGLGDAASLQDLPIGSFVHNVELLFGQGGQFARAAGAKIQLLRKKGAFVYVKLNSGEIRLLPSLCKATIGIVGNVNKRFYNLKKAGANRWLGFRPVVRGVAKNPVDHPHGGGQGKTKGGRCSVSPWGRLTKGKTTRSLRKHNKFILKSRRNIK